MIFVRVTQLSFEVPFIGVRVEPDLTNIAQSSQSLIEQIITPLHVHLTWLNLEVPISPLLAEIIYQQQVSTQSIYEVVPGIEPITPSPGFVLVPSQIMGGFVPPFTKEQFGSQARSIQAIDEQINASEIVHNVGISTQIIEGSHIRIIGEAYPYEPPQPIRRKVRLTKIPVATLDQSDVRRKQEDELVLLGIL